MMSKKFEKGVGYCRVSTKNQDLGNQVEKVRSWLESNCEDFEILKEKVSSVSDRPKLEKIFERLDEFDVLVVTKLDRFARSTKDFLVRKERLDESGTGFVTVNQPINTTNKYGRMMEKMLVVFAEFEREMIRERMNEGYQKALKENKVGKPLKIQGEALEDFKKWWKNESYSVATIKALLSYNHDVDVSKTTIYNTAKREGLD